MRSLMLAALAAFALAACNQGNSGPALPQVKAGATPPSVQSPASPTEQTEITDEVRTQLITQSGQLLDQLQSGLGGDRMAGFEDVIVPMQPGTDHRYVVSLTGGVQYGAIAICDGDCTNIDIEVISMDTGGVVANDMLPDDYPVASYTPEADGQYMIRMLMQACSRAPCYAGSRILTAPGQAPQPAVPAATGDK